MKKLSAFLLTIAVLLAMTACAAPDVPADSSGSLTDDAGNAQAEPAFTPTAADTETVFGTPEGVTDLYAFTVDVNGNVYAASHKSPVGKYTPDGSLIREYPGSESLCALRFCGGALYGVNTDTKDILRLDVDTGKAETVCGGTGLNYISSAAVSDKYICYVAIPTLVGEFETGADGYTDRHETLLLFDTKTGTLLKSAAVSHPVSLFGASDGTLYAMAHPDAYALFRIDPASDTAERIDGADGLEYVSAFALENGILVWNMDRRGIQAKVLPDGPAFSVTDRGVAVRQGGGFVFWRGNLLYPEDTADGRAAVGVLRLSGDSVVRVDYGTEEGTEAAAEPKGSITISGFAARRYFDQEALQRRTGITATFTYIPDNLWGDKLEQEFYSSLMAGDDSVDVYILSLGSATVQSIMKQGGYVPLSDSAEIREYLDRCFDWVEDCALTPYGEIWMLPLHFSTWALWYVPETFEKYGLTPENVRYLSDFCYTITMLNEVHTDDYADVRAQIWESSLVLQYESVFCDYENGAADFDNDEFRSLMDLMWSGFDMNKGEDHPFFERFLDEDDRIRLSLREYRVSPWNVPVHEIFALESIDTQLESTTDPEAWRALPNPRLDERVETNLFGCTCAIVNPYGKNRELAVEYLEAIASDSLHMLKLPDFVLEDPAAYEGVYDMTKPVYLDLHRIYRDGGTMARHFSQPERCETALHYQEGELTLDEFVDEIQRKAEFMIGE